MLRYKNVERFVQPNICVTWRLINIDSDDFEGLGKNKIRKNDKIMYIKHVSDITQISYKVHNNLSHWALKYLFFKFWLNIFQMMLNHL